MLHLCMTALYHLLRSVKWKVVELFEHAFTQVYNIKAIFRLYEKHMELLHITCSIWRLKMPVQEWLLSSMHLGGSTQCRFLCEVMKCLRLSDFSVSSKNVHAENCYVLMSDQACSTLCRKLTCGYTPSFSLYMVVLYPGICKSALVNWTEALMKSEPCQSACSWEVRHIHYWLLLTSDKSVQPVG